MFRCSGMSELSVPGGKYSLIVVVSYVYYMHIYIAKVFFPDFCFIPLTYVLYVLVQTT